MKQSEKKRNYVMTAGFAEEFKDEQPLGFIGLAELIWKKEPVDMLIFETAEPGTLRISVNGYHADTGEYVETKEVMKIQHPAQVKKFWLKYDDYGDHWMGTFLFPDEY